VNASSPLRFLITAGPTREFIDPVRFISNRSSGKMGYALAETARAVSPNTVLISGPTALTPPKGVEFVNVTTAQEMADAVFVRFEQCDVMIMAAAVCDFRPKAPAKSKIKKQTFGGSLDVVPTIDILAELGKRKQSQLLVGFAAETGDLEGNATEKLKCKRLDLIVANDANAFEAETNRVTLLDAAGQKEQLPEMSKRDVAAAIIERVLRLSR
jgi:phosphopantothenoylcysteine decarboxylase / phosphopantothenate---cysteine ligase